MKTEDLAAEICDVAGIDPDQLAHTMVVRWFPMGLLDKNGQPTPSVWTRGTAPPGNDSLIIFGMFQDTDEVRVYCLVNAAAPLTEKQKAQPPRRITLTKISPVMTSEDMALDVFKEEIAKELQLLAEIGADEIERDQIVGWLRSQNQLAVAQSIESGVHEDWEEEEEKPEEKAPEAQAIVTMPPGHP
jgi:hypothetical protein